MQTVERLTVAAITPFTTLDWPGKLCATLFVPECPWACPYCHNAKTLRGLQVRGWEDIETFLYKRRGLLDGVVFSGGEPSLYDSVDDAMRIVKDMGFGVAMHTGGSLPNALNRLLSNRLLDWVGIDYKAPLAIYDEVTGDLSSGDSVIKSLQLLREYGNEFEVRSTVGDAISNNNAIMQMARELAGIGIRDWVLQQCRDGDGIGGYRNSPAKSLLVQWAAEVQAITGIRCRVRTEDDPV